MNTIKLTDGEYNKYLNKYADKYRMKTAEDGIRCIRCKNGSIQPHSLIPNTTLLYEGEFNSKQAYTWFKKTLTEDLVISQDCDSECVIMFSEHLLPKIEKVFKIYKRRTFKPEVLEKLRARAKINFGIQ